MNMTWGGYLEKRTKCVTEPLSDENRKLEELAEKNTAGLEEKLSKHNIQFPSETERAQTLEKTLKNVSKKLKRSKRI